MTNNVEFNTVIEGGLLGSVFYLNGYGASVTKVLVNDPVTYNLGFLKQKDYYTWSCELDDNLRTLTEETEVFNLTEEQLDNYLTQIRSL